MEETVFVDRGAEITSDIHLILLVSSDLLVGHLHDLQLFVIVVYNRKLLLANAVIDDNRIAPLIVCADLDRLSKPDGWLPSTDHGEQAKHALLLSFIEVGGPLFGVQLSH